MVGWCVIKSETSVRESGKDKVGVRVGGRVVRE